MSDDIDAEWQDIDEAIRLSYLVTWSDWIRQGTAERY
jgi:hypothetical protein